MNKVKTIALLILLLIYVESISQSISERGLVYSDSVKYNLEFFLKDFTFNFYAYPIQGFERFQICNRGQFNVINEKVYFHKLLVVKTINDPVGSGFAAMPEAVKNKLKVGRPVDSIIVYLDYFSDNIKIIVNVRDTIEIDSGVNVIPFKLGDSLRLLHYLNCEKIEIESKDTALIYVMPFRDFFFTNYKYFPVKGEFREKCIILELENKDCIEICNQ